MTTRTVVLVAALGVLAPVAGALAAPSPYAPGEVLVKFRPGAAVASRAAALEARSHALRAALPDDWAHVRIRPGEAVEEAVAEYAGDAAVEAAQPNFVYHATVMPNDPDFGQQWALHNTGQTISSVLQPPSTYYGTTFPNVTNPGAGGDDIDVARAWGVTTDCSAAPVAVIDTGVNYDHQDLASNMWDDGSPDHYHGYDFVDLDHDPMDLAGHGTHVAGIIGAVGNNGIGTAGVCWTARIMAVRALDQFGTGTTASIIQGIEFAIANGAKVINMSLGGGGTYDPAYAAAISDAEAAGVLVVVAAGNDGVDVDSAGNAAYPCAFTNPNVLCVAALDQKFGLASFSNHGATSVDVGAPGTNILATWPGTHTLVHESYSSGWSESSTTAGATPPGGWGVSQYYAAATGFLAVPYDYWTTSNLYNAPTDDRAWKPFDTSGADVVTIELEAEMNVANGDYLRAACSPGGGDPFVAGSPLVQGTNLATYPNLAPVHLDVTRCASVSSTIGFQLWSQSGSPRAYGVAIAPFDVKKLAFDPTSYNTIDGTSMATPVVAGVAAMLRAYNPAFTYADTIAAIVGGGRPVASLAGVTSSGKAAQAMGALAFIRAPVGLAAVVH